MVIRGAEILSAEVMVAPVTYKRSLLYRYTLYLHSIGKSKDHRREGQNILISIDKTRDKSNIIKETTNQI